MAIGLALWLAGLGLGCGPAPSIEAPPSAATPESRSGAEAERGAETAPTTSPWLKGQLHLHSNASGDSETPPQDVARWYAEHGYDFIVFTDHNRITQVPGPEGLLVFAGIELTQNLERCTPPPEPGLSCLLHVNGLFVGDDVSVLDAIVPPTRPERLELYDHARRVTEALGGVAMLDHPNFHYAADAALLSALASRGLGLLEIANEAVDSNNEGDAEHPSTEALWDAVLSAGHRVWGVATDDAHHYYDTMLVRERGELAHVGDRGWVMVKAERSEASIRDAIERGDFYATNGVLLSEVGFDGDTLRVAVAPQAEGAHRFRLVGDGGHEHDRARGREASFAWPRGHQGYLRITVTDARGRKAWTQPVWREG